MNFINHILSANIDECPDVIFKIKDLVFELPKDFSGTKADAIRLVADYYEEMSHRMIYTGNDDKQSELTAVLTEIKEHPGEIHGRLSGSMGLFKKVNGEYISIE